MKGIKIGILGICFSLLGIAFATNNIFAISGAVVGLILGIAGCFVQNK